MKRFPQRGLGDAVGKRAPVAMRADVSGCLAWLVSVFFNLFFALVKSISRSNTLGVDE
jgi:hypothetical protein